MDAYTDKSCRPLSFLQARGVAIPDYAREAFSPTPARFEERQALCKAAFASGRDLTYPMHTAGDTLASLAHAIYYGADGLVTENLVKSANEFGIAADADAILAGMEVPDAPKVASVDKPQPRYALPEKQAYLIEHPYQVKRAAQQLEADKNLIPLSDFVDAAKAIVKYATESRTTGSVPPLLLPYAADLVPDFTKTKTAALQRAGLCTDDAHKSLYRDFADSLETKTAADARDVMVLLYDIDTACGVSNRKLAAAGVPDAYHAVYSTIPVSLGEKRAALCFTIGGKRVPVAAVQAIPKSARVTVRRHTSDFLDKVAALGDAPVSDELRASLAALPESAQQHILDLAVTYGPDTV